MIDRARALAALLREEHVDLEDLEDDPRVRELVSELAASSTPLEVSATLARSMDAVEAVIGILGLTEREALPDKWTGWAIRTLAKCLPAVEPFIYRLLLAHAAYPVICPALSKIDEGIDRGELARFVTARMAGGETVTDEAFSRNVARRLATEIGDFVEEYGDELDPAFREAFEAWRTATVDDRFVRELGRVWTRPFDSPPALLVGRRKELVAMVLAALRETPRRSILLVGEQGVGKTAIVRAALDQLPAGFVAFEASAAEVQAGSVFVGELETRIREIAQQFRGQQAVWVFPRLEEALFAGQHTRSPRGMLDALLTYVEAGDITLVGEVTPLAFEQLVRERPRVAGAFEVIRVRPLDEPESVEVARHALASEGHGIVADDRTLSESFELAQQFLPGLAPPGSILRLVRATVADAQSYGRTSFDAGDMLATIAATSGLPLAMLDPSKPLALADVQAFFQERVIGQPEAVDALVERIALAKAALADPTRPLGVLLFVGPTGTGKTEIAKALAEFMFGSASRLVRLDMSEYRTPDALERLLADSSAGPRGASLISAVRKDPFAVVLLDEFEKAAPPILDLFLQVFDDGRLTDHAGRAADFRRCVIVLTSNVGSSIATGRGLGFAPVGDPFRPEKVEEALRLSFRPELLNRIDRVVVFHPFDRGQMRALLDKELAEVLARRGLRNRPWAVEFDESAYEFLIQQGFSPEYGARPLKRAVERHVLVPLAAAIVEQRVPEGDQFLLVSAQGEQIDVTFVDPDAELEPVPGDAEKVEVEPGLEGVRVLARAPEAEARAVDYLLGELNRVLEDVDAANVDERKRRSLAAVNEPGFWDRDDRFLRLAEVEYLDRFEAALETAARLGDRLSRYVERSDHRSGRELVELLAVRLHVLERALAGLREGAPFEVFLGIRSGSRSEPAQRFVSDLTTMYRRWSKRRGMRMDGLVEGETERLFAVGGLGCGVILAPESGVHMLEVPGGDGDRTAERVTALVRVAPREPGAEADRASLVRHARAAIDEQPGHDVVVRRYQSEPTPLVRDGVRRYRTGRLDLVLAGDFDLF